MMALGAVFISLPMAMMFALYGCISQGLSTTNGLAIYAVVGTAIMLSFTLVSGLRYNDLG